MDGEPFGPARSAATIASSHLRIVRSRRRIRASRILVRPIRGGEGSGSGPTVSPIGLRRRIRQMIESGQLPALPNRRSWVGQGHGEPCLLCDQNITAAHWEHEVEIAPLEEIRAHGVCFRIWVEESEQLRKIA
jgi:hypothetical protein